MGYLLAPIIIPGYLQAMKSSLSPEELPNGALFVSLSDNTKVLHFIDPLLDPSIYYAPTYLPRISPYLDLPTYTSNYPR